MIFRTLFALLLSFSLSTPCFAQDEDFNEDSGEEITVSDEDFDSAFNEDDDSDFDDDEPSGTTNNSNEVSDEDELKEAREDEKPKESLADNKKEEPLDESVEDELKAEDDVVENKPPAVNEFGEVTRGNPEDVYLERRKEVLDLPPGLGDNAYLGLPYRWAFIASYGTQVANVEEDFTSTIPLPEDYTMYGLEIDYFFKDSPYYIGLRIDRFLDQVKDQTTKVDYIFNANSVIVGYELMDGMVNISGFAGLMTGVLGTATAKNLNTSATTEAKFKPGFGYTAALRGVVNYKKYYLGADAGIIVFPKQQVDAADFSTNNGTYLRYLAGVVF